MSEKEMCNEPPIDATLYQSRYAKIIEGRAPCVYAKLCGESGLSVGNVLFFSTPAGVVVHTEIEGVPSSKNSYEAFSLEIDGKRHKKASEGKTIDWETPSYRVKTTCLPPIYTFAGRGKLTFMTHLFSAQEIDGRRVVLKQRDAVVADGAICQARMPNRKITVH